MALIWATPQDAIAGIGAWMRRLLTVPLLFLLAGCAGIIPGGGQQAATPSAQPSAPTDVQVHRIALLAPLSGQNSDIGRSIANAATLAYIDTNAANIRLTTYDTAAGADAAARRALADGNRLILGPLLTDNVDRVAAVARPAGVPVLAFSNDAGNAQPGVFLLGQLPRQSVERVIRYAYGQGSRRFAAIVPTNVYGAKAGPAFKATVTALGGTMVGIERYDRSGDSARAALKRLAAKGKYDVLLIGDNGTAAMNIAPIARANGAGLATFLGTELWNTEAQLSNAPALRGALFASVSDQLYGDFVNRYRTRFGTTPFRLSTLGYDAALMTVALARDWPISGAFPWNELTDPEGFVGIDGYMRFTPGGEVLRTFEVQRIDEGEFTVVDSAPNKLP